MGDSLDEVTHLLNTAAMFKTLQTFSNGPPVVKISCSLGCLQLKVQNSLVSQAHCELQFYHSLP